MGVDFSDNTRCPPKNVPHLNLDYIKNYPRDVHDFGVIRKRVS